MMSACWRRPSPVPPVKRPVQTGDFLAREEAR